MHQVGNQVWAFNSVVKELDVFVKLFDEIIWIGFDHSDTPLDGTLLEIKHSQVKPILVKRSGGKGFWAKLGILKYAPSYIYLIWKYSTGSDLVHTRGPSTPMFFALLLSWIIKNPKWWFKYANDWNDPAAALTWRIQKKLMVSNRSIIGTVNGNWPGTPAHIIPFENPCLDEATGDKKPSLIKEREKKSLLFVGRIELKKGFKLVLDAINSLPEKKVERVQIIGDGPDRALLLETIKKSKHRTKFEYLGACSKAEVFAAMQAADFLLLPTTASEGFPKVVAEAWYNGCIPIVSDVSSLPQYVKDGFNGFVWRIHGEESYGDVLVRAFNTPDKFINQIEKNGYDQCSIFTYGWFEKRISNEILQFRQSHRFSDFAG